MARWRVMRSAHWIIWGRFCNSGHPGPRHGSKGGSDWQFQNRFREETFLMPAKAANAANDANDHMNYGSKMRPQFFCVGTLVQSPISRKPRAHSQNLTRRNHRLQHMWSFGEHETLPPKNRGSGLRAQDSPRHPTWSRKGPEDTQRKPRGQVVYYKNPDCPRKRPSL